MSEEDLRVARETNRRLHRRTQEAESKASESWIAGWSAARRSDKQQEDWVKKRVSMFIWKWLVTKPPKRR